MSIRPHGNRYQVRVSVGGGKRIERTLPPGATRQDAKDAEREIELQVRRAKIAAATGRRPDIYLTELLDRWVREEASKQKSWNVTKYKVAVLREHYLPGKTLADIQDVAGALREIDAKPATTNRYLSIIRRLGNAALEWELTDKATKIKMLPENNERHIYLTWPQVRGLMRRCDPEVSDALMLSAMTGLRRGELLRLTKASLRDGAIVLDAKTKAGKPRVIPLPPEGARIARKRLPFAVPAHTVRWQFERAREAVKLPHVQWRDLRHTYASFLAKAGVQTVAIKDLLGHSNVSVTNRYAHLVRDDLRHAVDKAFHGSGMGQKGAKKAA
jgi:integrase